MIMIPEGGNQSRRARARAIRARMTATGESYTREPGTMTPSIAAAASRFLLRSRGARSARPVH